MLATSRMIRIASLLAQALHCYSEQRRRNHSPSDRFAVQEAPIARSGFERMADRVPEIQDLAQAAFALVLVHHVRLDRRARGIIHESAAASRRSTAGMRFSRNRNSSASAITPYFTTS